jgi:hypothetical protein
MLNDCTTTLGILIAGLLQVETEEALVRSAAAACGGERAVESAERGLREWTEAVMSSVSPAA